MATGIITLLGPRQEKYANNDAEKKMLESSNYSTQYKTFYIMMELMCALCLCLKDYKGKQLLYKASTI